MKKQRARTTKSIGGDVYWAKALEEELDTDVIRDREICKVLRKIGVLSVSPIGNMLSKGIRWRLNIDKILEMVAEKPQNA